MGLEELLARFKPRETTIPSSNEPPLSGNTSAPGSFDVEPQAAPIGPERPEVPKIFRDNFSTVGPRPPDVSAQQGMPSFLQQQQSQNQGQFQQPQQAQFQQQSYPQLSPLEERLSRMEDKLKLIADKIDLMAQQVSVVWEMQRRRAP